MWEETQLRTDSIRTIPMLSNLGDAEIARIAHASRALELPAGSELFHDGDAGYEVFWLIRGWLRVAKSPNGSRVVLELPQPGDLVGEVAVLGAGVRSATVTTVTRCGLLALHRRDFVELVQQHQDVARRLLGRLADRLDRTTRLVEDVVFRGLPERLARCLIRLCEDHGEAHGGGTRIGLQLSQQGLGEMIGMSRESINKQIGIWQAEGLIEMQLGQVFIRDRTALETIAS